MVKIKVILGSTRPGRFGIQPAEWIMRLSKDIQGAEFELVDIKDQNLPLLDEPVSPMMRQYSKDHTKRWSKVIDDADGYVIVTAEYDHSIPAALKNAIDYLNHEWRHKPVSFLGYGAGAGGSRSIEHLRSVAGELHMYDLREQVLLIEYYMNLDESGQYKFTEQQEKAAQLMLNNTVFWATKMKPARTEFLNA